MRSTATTALATVCEETLLTPRPLEQRVEKRDGAVGIALVIQRSTPLVSNNEREEDLRKSLEDFHPKENYGA